MSDNDKPAVTLLRGGGTKDERAEIMRKLESDWESEVKFFALLAKMKKMNFDAYIAAGFTPAQALELIK